MLGCELGRAAGQSLDVTLCANGIDLILATSRSREVLAEFISDLLPTGNLSTFQF